LSSQRENCGERLGVRGRVYVSEKKEGGLVGKSQIPVLFPRFGRQDFQDNSLMINHALLTNPPKKEVNK